jgi:hypothetical protein
MNIFVLHLSAPIAAGMHSDTHVVKMTLETAQILATVHHLHGNGSAVRYKPTHPRHPCVVWASSSTANYRWLWQLGISLARQYRLRFKREHACQELFLGELRTPPPALRFAAPTPFAQAMPEELRGDDPVEAYRRYYRQKTAQNPTWMSWKRAEFPPLWLNNPSENNDLAAVG